MEEYVSLLETNFGMIIIACAVIPLTNALQELKEVLQVSLYRSVLNTEVRNKVEVKRV